MKLNNILIVLLAILVIAQSCTKQDGPTIDDNFLNYEIPDVPLTQDCTVGAYYVDPGANGWNAAVWDRLTNVAYDPAAGLYGSNVTPVLGNWMHQNATSPAQVSIFQQQVDWAIEAGLDFFVMPAFSENTASLYPNNINANQTRFADLLTGRIGSDGQPAAVTAGAKVDMKGLKYVLMLNPSTLNTGLNNNTPIENIAATTIQGQSVTRVQRFYDVVKRMSDYFADDNYYHIDGKPMIVIKQPQNIYSLDSKKFYDDMRSYIKAASGKDMYIVVQQNQWEPSPRFKYTFGDGRVDAVTINNDGGMYNQGDVQRSLLYPQMIDQNWKYNKDYLMSNWSEDFIPSVSPSFNRWVTSGNIYNIPIVERDSKTFITYCNVAKRNLGAKRIVLIDSYNDWNYNTAIEPADPTKGKGYGNNYLQLVRQQFKKN